MARRSAQDFEGSEGVTRAAAWRCPTCRAWVRDPIGIRCQRCLVADAARAVEQVDADELEQAALRQRDLARGPFRDS